jgi:hypothetical protein
MRTLALILASFIVCGTGFAQQTVAFADFSNNNTSAASAVNGSATRASAFDFGAVSKVSIHSLLDPSSNARIYAHLMPWFGTSGHINVGYDSAQSDQVNRQIEDMVSRGIDGVIIYWTGASGNGDSAHTNTAAMEIMKAAEQQQNFQFAIQEDKQALQACAAAGCDLTAALAGDLQYVAKVFFISPAYMTIDGRPVLFFFGLEAYKDSINWDTIRASVPGNPLFVFRNSVGFEYVASDGSFAWPVIDKLDPNDIGLKYLDNFYQVAGGYSHAVSIGSTYAGFNDQLASWGSGRAINRNCGDTWLQTFNKATQYPDNFSALQLVTWNDYEEGSQIEPGIDNCVSVQAAASNDTLVWTLSGKQSTIDHLAVWAASDNTNFLMISKLPTSARSVAFADMGLNPGTYSFVLQAVGQPSMLNHVSGPVTATISSAPALPLAPPTPTSTGVSTAASTPTPAVAPTTTPTVAPMPTPTVAPTTTSSGTSTSSGQNGAQPVFSFAPVAIPPLTLDPSDSKPADTTNQQPDAGQKDGNPNGQAP